MARRHTDPNIARDERNVVDVAAHLLDTEPAFSRNKHFDAFSDPDFKKALALYRRIKALTAELEQAFDRGMTVRVVDGVWAGRPAKQLTITGDGRRRTAWLPLPAWGLLRQRCPQLDAVTS